MRTSGLVIAALALAFAGSVSVANAAGCGFLGLQECEPAPQITPPPTRVPSKSLARKPDRSSVANHNRPRASRKNNAQPGTVNLGLRH